MKRCKLLILQMLVFGILIGCSPLLTAPLPTRNVVASTLPIELNWQLRLDGNVTQTPLLTEKQAAFVTERSLYLVDVNSGNQKWRVTNRASPYRMPMVFVEDSLLIGEYGGIVSQLDSNTGHPQWQTQVNDFPQSFINSIVVADDIVVVSSQPTEIVALSLLDGEIKWRISSLNYPISDRGVHVAYANNSEVYITGSETYIVDINSGNVERQIDLNTYQMQFVEGYIFAPYGMYDAKTLYYMFDLRAPTRKVPIRSCDGLQLPYTVVGETIVAADTCSGIYAMDLADGHVKWEYAPDLIASPPVAIRHDVVYILMLNGEIHAVNLNTGENIGILTTNAPIASYAIGDLTSRAVVSNGKMVIITFNEPTVLALSPVVN